MMIYYCPLLIVVFTWPLIILKLISVVCSLSVESALGHITTSSFASYLKRHVVGIRHASSISFSRGGRGNHITEILRVLCLPTVLLWLLIGIY